jgi:hypothetical protein
MHDDDDEHGQTADHARTESDDRRAPSGTAAPQTNAAPPLEPLLTARRRALRLAGLLGVVLLALAVVLAGNPFVREAAGGLVDRVLATPTATLAPGADQYYLLPSPPDIAVRLDGHALAGLRLVGPDTLQSLRLAPGRHRLEWRPRAYPFLPLACVVSVPHAPGDTCPLVAPAVTPGAASAQGSIVAMHDSLTTVVPAQYHPLLDAIQAALSAASSRAVVQPGGYYLADAVPFGSPAGVATQPLQVSLALDFTLLAGYPEPCAAVGLAPNPQPCRFPGQDCQQLCTLPTTSSDWLAGGMVQPVWTYTAPGGRVVAQNQGDPFNLQAVVILRINWDGAHWHVAPILGHTPGIPAADDLLCMASRDWLLQDGAWSFMVTPPPGAVAEYAAAPSPSEGCVVVLDPHPGADTPALFLQRFGVLLAADAAARLPGSTLPVATAADQRAAADLAAHYGL